MVCNIPVIVSFLNRTITKKNTEIVQGDYNTTKLTFQFEEDITDQTIVFQLSNPEGNLILSDDITKTREITLGGRNPEDDTAYSVFTAPGQYPFELIMYSNNSKLTSATGWLVVAKRQVPEDSDAGTEVYLPLFDDLLLKAQKIANVDVSLEETEKGASFSVTNQKGEGKTVLLRHGKNGDPGKSAYEIAVAHGFEGTEEEWLASLGTINVAVGEEEPTDEGIEFWVDIDKETTEGETTETIVKNYAKDLTWVKGERWVATSGKVGSYANAHRSESYIKVEAGSVYRIQGLFADGTDVASISTDMSLGVLTTDTDDVVAGRTKGFVKSSNYAKWADDYSYIDVTIPANSTRLYLNALYYSEGTNITDYVKVYKVVNGELETETVTTPSGLPVVVSETATLKFKNSKGKFQAVLPTGKFSKQYQYRYKYTDENDKVQKPVVKTLPFWLYEPKNSTNEKLPLIVVLHSSHVRIDSELGGSSENLDNMVGSMIYDDFTKYIFNGEFGDIPAYIVMPQTTTDPNGTRWTKRGTEIINLITACKQKYKDGDTSLISDVCLLGYSMGGTGAWEMVSAYPEIFKRVITVAGGLDGVTNTNKPYDPVLQKELEPEDYTREGRINGVVTALTTNSNKVWAIVANEDGSVDKQASIDICDLTPNAVCTVVESNHEGILKHCLSLKTSIIDFFTKS